MRIKDIPKDINTPAHYKNFDEWNDKKKKVDQGEKRPFFHEREIWFSHLGINVGFEEDGKGGDFLRPVLIVKKFSKEVFLAIPITKTEKDSKYYFPFSYKDGGKSNAILSQVRLIDSKRLVYLSGYMSEEDFKTIKQKIKQLLD